MAPPYTRNPILYLRDHQQQPFNFEVFYQPVTQKTNLVPGTSSSISGKYGLSLLLSDTQSQSDTKICKAIKQMDVEQ